MPKIDKYHFYEESVQDAEGDVNLFLSIYQQARGSEPRRLREDFCGTFQHSCEFIRRHPENTVEALDLDPEPLAYGKKKHLCRLKPEQRRRLSIQRRNVISVSPRKADLIVANNFSFYIFLERKTLLEYFKCARRSLGKKGVFILEMVGGPGFIEKTREQRTIKANGKAKFTYLWDQRSFDPITRQADYSISFRLPDGSMVKNAFTYHWRIWTIPEVRDVMAEAGFRESHVYWERSHRGEGTGEYLQATRGDNDWTWLAYVAGIV